MVGIDNGAAVQQPTDFLVKCYPALELLELGIGNDDQVPLDAHVPPQRSCSPEGQVMVPQCGVGVRGADVSTDQLRRQQQLGVADDLLALQRVDTVAGPNPIRTLNDSEVDPAATAGAGFDLQA